MTGAQPFASLFSPARRAGIRARNRISFAARFARGADRGRIDGRLTAHRRQRAGFAGVEVSAAQGSPPPQSLAVAGNRCEDAAGGDAFGRSAAGPADRGTIRARCGAGFAIGLALPAAAGTAGSPDLSEARTPPRRSVAAAPPDRRRRSQRSHGRPLRRHAPAMHEPLTPCRACWRAMRAAAFPVPIAAIARIPSPATAAAIPAAGDAGLKVATPGSLRARDPDALVASLPRSERAVRRAARVPRDDLAQPLRPADIFQRVVGAARAPRLMLSAVREGREAADAR